MVAIKLADVAEACCVDISTASRAMRNDPRVNAETVERIQKKASELGYRPNLLARSLAAGKTNMIAIMVHGLDPGPDNILYNAASRQLHERGYMSMIMPHHGSISQYERMIGQLGQGLVDGVLIIAGDPNAQRPALKLLQEQTPVVCLDRGLDDAAIPLVTGGHAQAIEVLIQQCRAQGVRTFITGFGEHNTAARARSVAVRALLTEQEIVSIDTINRASLSQIEGPCAFLISSQHHAQRIVQEYPDLFKQMEYYVACFDNWQGDCFPAQKAFVAIQDFEEMAKQAVDICIGLIDDAGRKQAAYQPIEVASKEFLTQESSYA